MFKYAILLLPITEMKSWALSLLSFVESCNFFFDEFTDEPKWPVLALPLTGSQSACAFFGACALGSVSGWHYLPSAELDSYRILMIQFNYQTISHFAPDICRQPDEVRCKVSSISNNILSYIGLNRHISRQPDSFYRLYLPTPKT